MGIILTEEQNNLVNEAYHWFYNSSEQVFQYCGGAGRGKSVVMNAIISRLGLDMEEILPMAYTGVASLVMRTKGLYNAKTIHSSLYTPCREYQIDNKTGSIIMDDYLNRPKTRMGFEPKDISGIRLMCIDEGGTVPYKMKHDIESKGVKILVCGDNDQLPPVKDKPAYLQTGKIRYITQPMRQSESDGIFYISERARLDLPIHKGYYGNALVIDEDELTTDMIRFSDVVICATNKTRAYYNKHIREDILRFNSDLPCMGERMICRGNNWNLEVDGINLVNGLSGSIINHPDVSSFDGKMYRINFHPFLANQPFRHIPCNYNYLNADYTKKQEIKNNPYEQGEMMEYGYCISTYLSQGSEHANVLYIDEDFIPDLERRSRYVGCSRATNFLIYVKKKKRYFFK